MKMICILVFSAFLFSCKPGLNGGYLIEGNIPGLPDGKIYLTKFYNGDTLDCEVVKNGLFTFVKKGKVSGDAVLLKIQDISLPLTLFIETGKISISGDMNKTGKILASGTPSNDAWNIYLQEVKPIQDEIDSTDKLRKQARLNRDTAQMRKLMGKRSELYESYYKFRKEFARKYNHTILAPMFLSAGIGDLDYRGIQKLLNSFSPDAPDNWYTNRLKERAEILKKCDYGQVAPNFTLPDPEGKQLALSDLRGQIVYVDF